MFIKIYEAILGTPIWVWLALVYLIFIGIINLKTRVQKLYTIFILPVIFLLIFIQSLISNYKFSLYPWTIWLTALFLSIIFSWLLFKNIKIKADKQKKLIQIAGSKSTLFLVLTVFIVKYFFGYVEDVKPLISENSIFITLKLIFSGGISGLFIGRALCYLYKYHKTRHENFIN